MRKGKFIISMRRIRTVYDGFADAIGIQPPGVEAPEVVEVPGRGENLTG